MDMSNNVVKIKEEEALDLILGFLILHKSKQIGLHEIHEGTLPHVHFDVFVKLVKPILNTNDGIVNSYIDKEFGIYDGGAWMMATGVTEQFLKQGGYTSVAKEKERAQSDELEERQLNKQVLRDQLHTNKVTRIISIISLLIAIGALVVSFFKQ
jgi:hypothetical protein